MAKDYTLQIRRAVLKQMKAAADITALVPVAQIHSGTVPANPTWPIIRWGVPIVISQRASCVDGSQVDITVHGHSKPLYNGTGAMIETAEDRAAKIGAAIAAALDRKKLSIEGDAEAYAAVRWQGSQVQRDGDENDAWHSVQNFRVRVIS